MTDLYKYRVYCNTEEIPVVTWSTSEPTVCPNNNTHTIDASKTVIIDKVLSDEVSIKEEDVPTGGHYKIVSNVLVCPANTTSTHNYSYPYDMTVLDMFMVTEETHKGDVLNLIMSPDTTIGMISADVAIDDTVINIPIQYMDPLKKGFLIKITDGVDTSDLGYILALDTVNGTITTSIGASYSHLASSPTYIQMGITPLDDIHIGPPTTYYFGDKKIGGSYVPANTPIRVYYENKSLTDEKTLYTYIEKLY